MQKISEKHKVSKRAIWIAVFSAVILADLVIMVVKGFRKKKYGIQPDAEDITEEDVDWDD